MFYREVVNADDILVLVAERLEAEVVYAGHVYLYHVCRLDVGVVGVERVIPYYFRCHGFGPLLRAVGHEHALVVVAHSRVPELQRVVSRLHLYSFGYEPVVAGVVRVVVVHHASRAAAREHIPSSVNVDAPVAVVVVEVERLDQVKLVVGFKADAVRNGCQSAVAHGSGGGIVCRYAVAFSAYPCLDVVYSYALHVGGGVECVVHRLAGLQCAVECLAYGLSVIYFVVQGHAVDVGHARVGNADGYFLGVGEVERCLRRRYAGNSSVDTLRRCYRHVVNVDVVHVGVACGMECEVDRLSALRFVVCHSRLVSVKECAEVEQCSCHSLYRRRAAYHHFHLFAVRAALVVKRKLVYAGLQRDGRRYQVVVGGICRVVAVFGNVAQVVIVVGRPCGAVAFPGLAVDGVVVYYGPVFQGSALEVTLEHFLCRGIAA